MPDPLEQLAADTVARDYGGRPPLSIDDGLAAPPIYTRVNNRAPVNNGALLPRVNNRAPVNNGAPLPQYGGRPALSIDSGPIGGSYDNVMDGFFGRGQGTPAPQSPPASLPAEAPPWPPSMAGFGEQPIVEPRAEKPGLLRRMGGKLLEGLTGGARKTPEEQVAERSFAAQAELEARGHPYFDQLKSDEAKLRFSNIFRRRYGLDPLDKLPGPATAGEVFEKEWMTFRGLAEKLPYVEALATAAELGFLDEIPGIEWAKKNLGLPSVRAALNRVNEGKGTAADFETITELQERMAKESRGTTWGGTVVKIPSQSVPFMAELATGGAITRIGTKGAEKLAGKVVQKEAAKAAADAMRKMAGKASEATILGTLGKAGVETARRGLPSIAVQTTADTFRRTLPGFTLQPGDDKIIEGAITTPGQPFLGALRDSGINATIQVYSEYTGKALGHLATKAGRAGQKLAKAGAKLPVTRVIAVPAEKAAEWMAATRASVAAELVKRFPNKYLTFQAAWRHLREVGYNQPFEEIGEERVAELMEAAAKAVIERKREKSTLQYHEMPSIGQLTAEFAGFLIPGAVAVGASALVPEDARLTQAVKQGWEAAINDGGGVRLPTQRFDARGTPPPTTPPGPGEADIQPTLNMHFPDAVVEEDVPEVPQVGAKPSPTGDIPQDVGVPRETPTSATTTEATLSDDVEYPRDYGGRPPLDIDAPVPSEMAATGVQQRPPASIERPPEPEPDHIPDAGKMVDPATAARWSVYPTKGRSGKTYYSVRESDDPRGYGDTLHPTEEEARKYAAEAQPREEANLKSREESRLRREQEEAKVAEEKAEREDIDDFMADANPMTRGSAVKILNQQIRSGGVVATRKEHIRRAIEKGVLSVKSSGDEDVLMRSDGRVEKAGGGYQEDVAYQWSLGSPRTEVAYAKHLLGQKRSELPAPILTGQGSIEVIESRGEKTKPGRVRVKGSNIRPGDVIRGMVDGKGGDTETIASVSAKGREFGWLKVTTADGRVHDIVGTKEFYVNRKEKPRETQAIEGGGAAATPPGNQGETAAAPEPPGGAVGPRLLQAGARQRPSDVQARLDELETGAAGAGEEVSDATEQRTVDELREDYDLTLEAFRDASAKHREETKQYEAGAIDDDAYIDSRARFLAKRQAVDRIQERLDEAEWAAGREADHYTEVKKETPQQQHFREKLANFDTPAKAKEEIARLEKVIGNVSLPQNVFDEINAFIPMLQEVVDRGAGTADANTRFSAAVEELNAAEKAHNEAGRKAGRSEEDRAMLEQTRLRRDDAKKGYKVAYAEQKRVYGEDAEEAPPVKAPPAESMGAAAKSETKEDGKQRLIRKMLTMILVTKLHGENTTWNDVHQYHQPYIDKLVEALTKGTYSDVLDPANKNTREVYTLLTGIKLPKTIKGTAETLRNSATFTTDALLLALTRAGKKIPRSPGMRYKDPLDPDNKGYPTTLTNAEKAATIREEQASGREPTSPAEKRPGGQGTPRQFGERGGAGAESDQPGQLRRPAAEGQAPSLGVAPAEGSTGADLPTRGGGGRPDAGLRDRDQGVPATAGERGGDVGDASTGKKASAKDSARGPDAGLLGGSGPQSDRGSPAKRTDRKGSGVPDELEDALRKAHPTEDAANSGRPGEPVEETPKRPNVQTSKPRAPAGHSQSKGGVPDYVISEPGELFVSGKKSIYKRNVAAIRLLKKIQEEKRPATEDEKAILVRYQGWGSVAEAFDWRKPEWSDEYSALQELLTDEEHDAASRSTRNAMYTPPEIVSAFWVAMQRLGFTGGSVLETSAGVGHFLGLQPRGDQSRRVAVEKDNISAGILALLYPASKVHHSPFEEAPLPKNYFDVVGFNFPFGESLINDRRYPKAFREFIHDYFFVRGIDLVRPGGILAAITTKGTMDKLDPGVRKHIATMADLIGAVRLNEDSLPGTKVTTDIIFLRRRAANEAQGGEAWIDSIPYPKLPGKYINEYFQRNPHMVLGEIQSGSLYHEGKADPTATIVAAREGFDLARDLAEALNHLPENVYGQVGPAAEAPVEISEMIANPKDLPPNVFFVHEDGTLYKTSTKGEGAEVVERFLAAEYGRTTVDRIKALAKLRDATLKLLRAQADKAIAEEIPARQKALNKAYDALVNAGFGPIHAKANVTALAEDPLTFPTVAALEDYDPITKKAKKSDLFTRDIKFGYEAPTRAENVGDALNISRSETYRVDLPRIAELLDLPEDAATRLLIEENLVYELPDGELVVAAEYLSGHVRAKLKEAKQLAELDERYQRNVDALAAVMPVDLAPSEIQLTIGAPWIPKKVIKDFLLHIVGEHHEREVTVEHAESTGRWMISMPVWLKDSQPAWGTDDRTFYDLIKAELNMKEPVVKRGVLGMDDHGQPAVLEVQDEAATSAARAALQRIRDKFQRWVWDHPTYGSSMHTLYNDNRNAFVKPEADGSHLTFPGANPAIEFYKYQKDGVYWTLSSPGSTLLHTGVGGGKTFMLTAIAQELLRLGRARKPVIVVERATLNGFIKLARHLYPSGRFIALSTDDLKPERKAKTLAKLAVAERTVFIIPHDQFRELPIGEDTLNRHYKQMIEDLLEALEAQQAADDAELQAQGGAYSRSRGKKNKSFSVKQIEKMIESLENRLKEKLEKIKRAPTIPFEELGIDWILYDESQAVKNLMFTTMITDVRGLGAPQGNQKTTDLWIKARYVQGLQNGRGLTFATGTPVDNSISEIYSIQRYLQNDLLREMGIRTFDDWVREFAKTGTDFEKVGQKYKKTTRLVEFRNPAVLYQLWGQIAHTVPHSEIEAEVKKQGKGDVPLRATNSKGQRDYEVIALDPTPNMKEYQPIIKARYDAAKARKGPPVKGEDIILSIIGDEAKASLDMRVVDPSLPEEPGNKMNALIPLVVKNYHESNAFKGTQLLFINSGVPGKGKKPKRDRWGVPYDADHNPAPSAWDSYGEAIRLLVAAGIPRQEIGTIVDAKTDAQKLALFEKVNRGEIRILIGSMKKMGTGVNVQEKVIASYQVEPPWTPGMIDQMDGRSIRQGNRNPWGEVRMYRLVIKGMSDEFKYGLLSKKKKVNDDFLTGKIQKGVISDLNVEVMAYRLAMGEASESKVVFDWTKAENRMKQLQGEYNYHLDSQINLRRQKVDLTNEVARLQKRKEARGKAAAWLETLPESEAWTVAGKEYEKPGEAGEAILELLKRAERVAAETEQEVGSYRGFRILARRRLNTDMFKIRGSFVVLNEVRLRPPAGMSEEYDRARASAHTTSDLKFASQDIEFGDEGYTANQLAAWLGSARHRAVEDPSLTDQKAVQMHIDRVETQLSGVEKTVGAEFDGAKELDEITLEVQRLSALIAEETAKGAHAADGRDTNSSTDEDEEERDEGEGGGGTGEIPGFPPDKESLLPRNMSPEYRQWLREHWHEPVFGMGAMSMGRPAPDTKLGQAWQTYADTWDASVEKMKNLGSADAQKVMDYTARLLYGGQWKFPVETPAGQAFERVRGAKHIAGQKSIIFNQTLDKIIQSKRKGDIGKPWPEGSWDVIRQTAMAVLSGAHRRPQLLPRDMLKIWKTHFGWVKHVSTAMTPKDRRLEIDFQLERVDQQIDILRASTLVTPMPDAAWDAYAIAEHRKILSVVKNDSDYDSLDSNTLTWLRAVKQALDDLTDEMLNDPVALAAARGGGLINFEDIVRMRRESGAIYLRSLYHIVRDPSIIPGLKRETLGPRLPLSMTKAKRAKDLWTVTLANGQQLQFQSEDDAVAAAEAERIKYAKEYGESVNRRVQVLEPLTDRQIEWLGPVEDVRVLVAKTLTGMYLHIDTARMFAVLNSTDAINEHEYNDLSEDEKHKYRKLPDSKALFLLSGKYVPEAVHYNLMDSRLAVTGLISEAWSLFLQMFKSAVVVLSPATWMRQLYGQTVFWILGGLNPLTHHKAFQQAAQRLSKGMEDPIVYDLMHRNALHGGIDKEFHGHLGDALRTPANGVAAAVGIAWEKMKRAKDELGSGYQLLDHLTVLASWIRDVEMEGLPEEVALANLNYWQNYERVGVAARFLRKLPLGDPFASFSDQAVKIVLKSMREHPGRVLAMYAAPAIINLSARMMFGVTDEEMTILNTHHSRKSAIDRYFQPVLFRDSAGLVHTLDLRWSMPLASDFRVQTGADGIGIPFMLKQPIFGPLFDVAYNRKKYTGQDISERGDPLSIWQAAGYIAWESAPLPKIATRAPLRLYRAITGQSDENFIQILLQEIFGIRIVATNATKAKAYDAVHEAIGEKNAKRAVQLINFYNRYKKAKDTPITEDSLEQSARSRALAAARRAG